MRIKIDDELFEIMRKIEASNKSSKEWAEIESGDMFQSENYTGSFEADEMQFCFSYYENDTSEYWFQFSLTDVKRALSGDIKEFEARVAT